MIFCFYKNFFFYFYTVIRKSKSALDLSYFYDSDWSNCFYLIFMGSSNEKIVTHIQIAKTCHYPHLLFRAQGSLKMIYGRIVGWPYTSFPPDKLRGWAARYRSILLSLAFFHLYAYIWWSKYVRVRQCLTDKLTKWKLRSLQPPLLSSYTNESSRWQLPLWQWNVR